MDATSQSVRNNNRSFNSGKATSLAECEDSNHKYTFISCLKKWACIRPIRFVQKMDEQIRKIALTNMGRFGHALVNGTYAGFIGAGMGAIVATVAAVKIAAGPLAGAVAAIGAAAIGTGLLAYPSVGVIKGAASGAVIAGGLGAFAEIIGLAADRILPAGESTRLGEIGAIIPSALLSGAIQTGIEDLLDQRIRLISIKRIQFGLQIAGGAAILLNLSQVAPFAILGTTTLTAGVAAAILSLVKKEKPS